MSLSFERLETLYREAMTLVLGERESFIEKVDDPELQAELRELVAARTAAEGFFERHPEVGLDEHGGIGSVQPGEVLGEFRLERVIASGGMGTVFLAEQRRPPRAVALKVIRPEMASSVAVERFELEAEVLGTLEHPGIAQVFGAGVDENASGQVPWIAMEFIDGQPLDAYLQERELPLRERLELFVELCRAAEHAHRRGIIHRDLKPANVLVRADARPKILDFGLARVADVAALGTIEADLGQVVGTIAYMSPEQTRGDARQVDTRTDVYALGIMLYEVLSGRRARDLSGRTPLEALAIIQDEDPPRLSTHEPALRGDLEVIVERAMERDRERRYGSAEALAEDVEHFLAHRPIVARPSTLLYRVRKFVRRNPGLTAAFAATLAALLIGAVGTFLGLQRAQKEARLKDEALLGFERLADVRRVEDALAQADELWPPRPQTIGPMKSWIAAARVLIGRRAQHEAALALLRQAARPYDEEERRRDHGERLALIAQLEQQFEELEADLERARGARLDRMEDELAELEERIATLRETTRTRTRWSFGEDRLLQWKADVLEGLLRDLDELEGTALPDVQRRLERAQAIARQTVEEHGERWAKVAARLESSERYPGLSLRPQVGLIPLGPDPESRCLEFLHFESHRGPVPERNPEGKIAVDGDTGIILVLVPGGSFWMGASREEGSRNLDPNAREDEGPVHAIELSPYFLAKHELTRGQWERISGRADPSHWVAENTGGLVPAEGYRRWPVEQVSFDDCRKALRRVGLELPTEAQWERACRAGTSSVYNFGDDPGLLHRHANLADRSYASASDGARHAPAQDDGHPISAPVGSYAPNAPRPSRQRVGVVPRPLRQLPAPGGSEDGIAHRPGQHDARDPRRQLQLRAVAPALCVSALRATRFQDQSHGMPPGHDDCRGILSDSPAGGVRGRG